MYDKIVLVYKKGIIMAIMNNSVYDTIANRWPASMTLPTIITISANCCALLIFALLLTGILLNGRLPNRLYRHFLALVLFALAGSLCELSVSLLYGTPGLGFHIVIRMLDIFSYTFGNLTLIAFELYLFDYLSMKSNVSRKSLSAALFFATANIPFMAVAQFLQIFIRLDEHNNYILADMWGTMIFQVTSLLICNVIIFKNIKNMIPKEWISLLLYMILPQLCYVAELIYPGVWISYLGAAVSIFLIYVNLQVELSHKVRKQELELDESRIAVMLSQIRPHFLYNSLTAIGQLCDMDSHKAKEAVNHFAHYLRGNLDSLGQREMIAFADELTHVETYLALEKLRFGDRLQVVYDIGTESFMLPPLTVQPIVENAVRYGLNGQTTGGTAGGTVTVSVREHHDHHQITVTDNGTGFDPDNPPTDGRRHIGIANVRERLVRLCNGKLELNSVPGGGTAAVISIPKETLIKSKKFTNGKVDSYEYHCPG